MKVVKSLATALKHRCGLLFLESFEGLELAVELPSIETLS
jgi:hypothetical protein